MLGAAANEPADPEPTLFPEEATLPFWLCALRSVFALVTLEAALGILDLLDKLEGVSLTLLLSLYLLPSPLSLLIFIFILLLLFRSREAARELEARGLEDPREALDRLEETDPASSP